MPILAHRCKCRRVWHESESQSDLRIASGRPPLLPIAHSDAELLHAPDSPDAGREIGAEEATVGGLVRKTEDCSEPHVDRLRALAELLQETADSAA